MSQSINSLRDPRARANHTVRGMRMSTADWRLLAALFRSGRCGLDGQRQQALLQAARQLDAQLNRPLERFELEGCSVVEVFGQIGYIADHDQRALGCSMRDRFGAPYPIDVNVSLLPALNGTTWLAMLLDAWCIDWRSSEGGTSFAEDAQEALFLRTLRRMLEADARFRLVRRKIGLLLLGPDFHALALRSRAGEFDADHATRVWQHHEAFAEVARVHPKLLPVLTLLLRAGAFDGEPPPTADDVLRRMRAALAARLPGAAWRWLVRHGVRFLLPFGRPRLELGAMVAVAGELAAAGFPPPPSARFMQSWRSLNGALEGKGKWCVLPVRIRRGMLAEAVRRAALPGFAEWCGEAERVMFAVTTPGDSVAELPKRCGYAWLKKRAAEIEYREQMRHALAGLQWPCPIGEVRIGNRSVVPLQTGIAMFEEALYMRSCLAEYAKPCSEGRALVFSVRDDQGRPVANLLFRRNAHARWEFAQAKRRFNRLPGDGLLALAGVIGALLQSNAATKKSVQLDPEAS